MSGLRITDSSRIRAFIAVPVPYEVRAYVGEMQRRLQAAMEHSEGGRRAIRWVQPEAIHQRIGFVFGSSEEVARIEGYHRDEPPATYSSPLFGKRGLFAEAS